MKRSNIISSAFRRKLGLSSLKPYGYTYEGMLCIPQAKALEFFDNDLAAIYIIHNDNTESQVDSRDEILNNTLFGIEVEDLIRIESQMFGI